MDDTEEFISYKKIVIFGAKSTGKTTFTNYIIKGKFSEVNPSNDGI